MATNARYFEKFGISTVTSTTTGAITGFIGFIAQAVLVILTIVIGAGSIDFSEMQGGGGAIKLLVTAFAIFIGVIIVVLLVPKLRHWAEDKLRGPFSQMGDAFKTVKDPKRALTALGSSMGTEILYGAGFAMCVLAVGGSVSLGEAVFINVTVSLFAGLMPVPGGVGVLRGRYDRGTRGDRSRQRPRGLGRADLPARQLLPASALGVREPAMARQARLPVTP